MLASKNSNFYAARSGNRKIVAQEKKKGKAQRRRRRERDAGWRLQYQK